MKSHLLAGVALFVPSTMVAAQAPPGTVAAPQSAPEPNSTSPGVAAPLPAPVITEPAAAAPAAAAPAGLQDIVITAQRRSESLQRAAIAVDVVSSESILSSGVTKATDLTALVPALQGTGAGGSTSFYIRGVGAFTANAYTDPGVAFNYDGVYIARPAATAGMFFDIDRVEVLKGPQGTLYGRNRRRDQRAPD